MTAADPDRRPPSLVHALFANAELGAAGPSTYVLDDRENPTDLRHDVLAAASMGTAKRLADEGVQPGDRVLLCMKTSPAFVTAFLGAMTLGAVPAAVSPPMGFGAAERFGERLARLIGYLEPTAMVTTTSIGGRVEPDVLGAARLVDGDRLHEAATEDDPTSAPDRMPEPDDLAFVQCTSGSTGAPKGVMITHANLAANCSQIDRIAAIEPGESTVHWLPLHHDMGLIGGMFVQMYAAIDAVILPPTLFLRRPGAWLRAVSRFRGAHTAAPNFGFRYATDRIRDGDLDGVDLSTWRFLFCGAEPIHLPTMQRFLDRFAPWGLRPDSVAPCYGMAEGTLAITVASPATPLAYDVVDRTALAATGEVVDVGSEDPEAMEIIDCGPPLDGTEVQVVDAGGRPVPERCLGQIRFRGPSTTPGYFREPGATADVLDDDGWFDTGDLGYLRDGRLRITGREKEMIIVRGANYFPADFEQAAETVVGVKPGGVAAIGRFDPEAGTEGLYLVVEVPAKGADHHALELEIRGAVSSRTGIVPSAVLLVPRRAIPTTSSGKVQRVEAGRQLVDPHLAGART